MEMSGGRGREREEEKIKMIFSCKECQMRVR
jgi:hypothetical protein